jgi:hypothetical protein
MRLLFLNKNENVYAPSWVCYKLVSEQGYNTWPAWDHERVA